MGPKLRHGRLGSPGRHPGGPGASLSPGLPLPRALPSPLPRVGWEAEWGCFYIFRSFQPLASGAS